MRQTGEISRQLRLLTACSRVNVSDSIVIGRNMIGRCGFVGAHVALKEDVCIEVSYMLKSESWFTFSCLWIKMH